MNGGGMQQLAFETLKLGLYQIIRITNSSRFEAVISSFEMFGSIHLKNSSLNLSKLTKSLTPKLNFSSIYSFQFNERFGLLSFILMLSAKDAIDSFLIGRSSSSTNSSFFKLLKR
jgi:hypothetical protein